MDDTVLVWYNKCMQSFPYSRRWQITPLNEYVGLSESDKAWLKQFDREWAATTGEFRLHGKGTALNKAAKLQRQDAMSRLFIGLAGYENQTSRRG